MKYLLSFLLVFPFVFAEAQTDQEIWSVRGELGAMIGSYNTPYLLSLGTAYHFDKRNELGVELSAFGIGSPYNAVGLNGFGALYRHRFKRIVVSAGSGIGFGAARAWDDANLAESLGSRPYYSLGLAYETRSRFTFGTRVQWLNNMRYDVYVPDDFSNNLIYGYELEENLLVFTVTMGYSFSVKKKRSSD